MRTIVPSILVLGIAVLGCGREAADTSRSAESTAQTPAPAAERVSTERAAGLDIEGTDSETLCRRLVPENLQALGVSDRWSAERRLVHRKLYGDRRVSCAWEGFDPERPASSPTTFFKIEVECGKDAPKLCADKVSAPKPPGALPYDETVDGALCHTLNKGGSNNWIILENGCFVILYQARPEIAGLSAEERERRVRETKLAVARAVVANVE